MPFGDDAERTEAATPRRREQAREEGKAVKSREVIITVLFLSNVLFFSVAGRSLYEHMLTLTREAFLTLGEVEISLVGLPHLYTRYLNHLATMLLPLLLTTFALTLGCHLLQTGFLFSLHSLAPQWSHINPARGLQQILSVQGLNELVKSLLKISVIGYVAYRTIIAEVEHFFAVECPRRGVDCAVCRSKHPACMHPGLVRHDSAGGDGLCLAALAVREEHTYEQARNEGREQSARG